MTSPIASNPSSLNVDWSIQTDPLLQPSFSEKPSETTPTLGQKRRRESQPEAEEEDPFWLANDYLRLKKQEDALKSIVHPDTTSSQDSTKTKKPYTIHTTLTLEMTLLADDSDSDAAVVRQKDKISTLLVDAYQRELFKRIAPHVKEVEEQLRCRIAEELLKKSE